MEHRRRASGALAVLLIAGACSGGHPQERSSGYDVAAGGNKLILSISTFGGMTRAYYNWTFEEPLFSLYRDGRVILRCDQADVEVPTVLPCVNETQVSPDEVQRIVAAADAAGLLSDGTFDADLITDGSTTVFQTTVGGSTHKVEAYFLETEARSRDQSIDAERQRLIAFRTQMEDLGGFLGRSLAKKPYVATSLTVVTHQVDASSVDAQTPMSVWPLAMDPSSSANTAFTLTGDDMAAFISATQNARVDGIWHAPSGFYEVSAHPGYPDEQSP